MDVPVNLSGSLTLFFLVLFGIFVYPWLLKRRGGLLVVAGVTAALAVLFYFFDSSIGTATGTSVLLACIWASLPALTALLVKFYQDKGASKG